MVTVIKSKRLEEFLDKSKFNSILTAACAAGLAEYLVKCAPKDFAAMPWDNKKLTDNYYYFKTGKERPKKKREKKSKAIEDNLTTVSISGQVKADAKAAKSEARKARAKLKKAGVADAPKVKKEKKPQREHNKRGTADLFLYGTLRNEFLVEAVKSIEETATGATAKIRGKTVPYAAAHQYGYIEGKLPKRRYIRLVENEKDIARAIRRFLKRRLSK